MEELKCYNNEDYRVYDKRRMPKRYHFTKSNRIGDIILDGKLGTIFYEYVSSGRFISFKLFFDIL